MMAVYTVLQYSNIHSASRAIWNPYLVLFATEVTDC